MLLINCENNLNLILNYIIIYSNCVILSTDVANEGTLSSVTDTEHFALIITLSTHDNINMLQELEFSFKKNT